MNKDIMYVDFDRHRKWFSLRLCCLQSFDYDISPILQEFYSLKWIIFVYYIWYIAFIESYYFLCVMKTIA